MYSLLFFTNLMHESFILFYFIYYIPLEKLLKIFERKILRKIYGPIQEGDIWRIRNNEELNRSINEEDIVKFI